ncbi:MAG: signal recognition particle-docking protein FtsY [Lachnospiraceae bacterium]|nr:signal recognition particle-docking protein FtsY [Lachnospiraceae bacterium]
MALNFFKNLFSVSELDDDFYDELEETLIMSDVGMKASAEILDDLKVGVRAARIKKADQCREILKLIMKQQLEELTPEYPMESEKTIVLVVGVNGVGKTTTIGKLAFQLKQQGIETLLVAADTFRAGAAVQLGEWAVRSRTEMVSQREGADPAAVLYDGIRAARARGARVVLCDTAGRLHNKKNLMEELRKMRRVAEREAGDYRVFTLLVLDATTGQNALNQARQFLEVTHVDALALTKLDGTAKGGIAIAIQEELGIPVAYMGLGERISDLKKFDTDEYLDKLLGLDGDEETEEEE